MIARLARTVSVRTLRGEETVAIEATPEERAALAEALELLELRSLTADVTVRPWRVDGVRVAGSVRGEVVQACVVTLEPVGSTVEETFEVRLHPDAPENPGVEFDPEGEDPPERLDTDALDVGAIALEHFILGIDPYPRVPGAAWTPPEDEEPEPSPFAALAVLKNGAN